MFARVAEFFDGLALDIFHHDILTAVFGHAAVEQARDVRVVEPGQNAALLAKAALDLAGHQTWPDQLDGDLFAVSAAGALGQKTHTHPSSPDFAHNPIWSDHSTGGLAAFIGKGDGGSGNAERPFPKVRGDFLITQHPYYLRADPIVSVKIRGQELRSR